MVAHAITVDRLPYSYSNPFSKDSVVFVARCACEHLRSRRQFSFEYATRAGAVHVATKRQQEARRGR